MKPPCATNGNFFDEFSDPCNGRDAAAKQKRGDHRDLPALFLPSTCCDPVRRIHLLEQ
jgi:hypothetical protein